MKIWHLPIVRNMHIKINMKKCVRSLLITCALVGVTGSLLAKSPEVQKPSAYASQNRLVLAAKYREQTRSSDFLIVEYTIQKTGAVIKPTVVASTRPALSQKILAEVAKWQFDERARDSRVRQRIVFR